MRKAYIAGPFFSADELAAVQKAEKIMEKKGFVINSPRLLTSTEESRKYVFGTREWSEYIFRTDRDAIDDSDLMVVLYYGNLSDTGTAFEVGYAYAKGIPAIICHMDKDTVSNLMIHEGCRANIMFDALNDYDFDTMPPIHYFGKMT